jgi:DNA-binding NtrC family response regulator
MRAVRARLEAFAAVPWPVRIEGPTGTGKALAARFLHCASPRAAGPFIAQAVTLLDRGLALAELLGWGPGAFTGAIGESPGAFERAHGGTLFLDELACARPRVQAALLQLLEDGQVKRMGEPRARRVDVRLVFATNASLEDAVAAGAFQRDLYYRLGALIVQMPALKDHAADIPEIAAGILARRAAEAGQNPPRLRPDELARLRAYHWPGNVRQLDHVLQLRILFTELPERFDASSDGDWHAELDDALRRHGGNKAATARQLGVSVRTVHRALAGSDSQ